MFVASATRRRAPPSAGGASAVIGQVVSRPNLQREGHGAGGVVHGAWGRPGRWTGRAARRRPGRRRREQRGTCAWGKSFQRRAPGPRTAGSRTPRVSHPRWCATMIRNRASHCTAPADLPDERHPDEQARPQAPLAQGQQGQPRPQAQRLSARRQRSTRYASRHTGCSRWWAAGAAATSAVGLQAHHGDALHDLHPHRDRGGLARARAAHDLLERDVEVVLGAGTAGTRRGGRRPAARRRRSSRRRGTRRCGAGPRSSHRVRRGRPGS